SKIEKLIKLFDESSISEIEINEGEESIRLAKITQNIVMEQQAPQTFVTTLPQQHQTAPPLTQAATPSSPTTQAPIPESEEIEGEIVRSPMVGTFYLSASPEAAAFISVGHQINPGDTLCIIEAMKIMNQIESETSGTIKKILIEDGTPVEYDQPLFIVG
ncbi:MAG: acetyl-CoA carboxylase biotin carboxyl carrier protein, partial [Francisellaceae bacterium]